MSRVPLLRLVPLALATGALAVAPVFAKGGKAQVINWHMTPTVDDLDARGKLQFKGQAGKEQFYLTVHRLASGTYSLDVDGVSMATFDVGMNDSGDTQGKLRLKAKKGNLPFDPRGHELAVSQNGTAYLTAAFPASLTDAVAAAMEIEVGLDPSGAIPGALGEAEFETEEGESEFEVKVSDLPEGTYDLIVGGVIEGQITVNAEGRGEIEFSTDPEDQDEDGEADNDLLLTFDPRGQLVQVGQAGTVVLEVAFPTVGTGDDDQGEDDDDQGEDDD